MPTHASIFKSKHMQIVKCLTKLINFVIPRRNMQDLENVLMPQMLINQDLMLILIFTDKKFSLILSPQLGN